jgi:hypothetical protein
LSFAIISFAIKKVAETIAVCLINFLLSMTGYN